MLRVWCAVDTNMSVSISIQYKPSCHGWLDHSKTDRMIKLYILKMMSCFIYQNNENKIIRVGLILTCLDSDGILQTVEYIADEAGFR